MDIKDEPMTTLDTAKLLRKHNGSCRGTTHHIRCLDCAVYPECKGEGIGVTEALELAEEYIKSYEKVYEKETEVKTPEQMMIDYLDSLHESLDASFEQVFENTDGPGLTGQDKADIAMYSRRMGYVERAKSIVQSLMQQSHDASGIVNFVREKEAEITTRIAGYEDAAWYMTILDRMSEAGRRGVTRLKVVKAISRAFLNTPAPDDWGAISSKERKEFITHNLTAASKHEDVSSQYILECINVCVGCTIEMLQHSGVELED